MDIDKKVQSVRRIESAEEIKKYEGRSALFKNYMKEIAQKSDKPLLKIANVYIPFSLGILATSAGGSIVGFNNNEVTLHEVIKIIGKTAAVDAAGALGLVVATIGAVSITEAIKFTRDYISYPKNKEDLIRLGIYNQTQDALSAMKERTFPKENDSTKGVSK